MEVRVGSGGPHPLAAAVRRGAHRCLPGAGRHRQPGGRARWTWRWATARGARSAPTPDGEPRRLRRVPQGRGGGAGHGTGDPPSLRRAIGFYEQAVALDSRSSQAWAQLSRAHALALLQRRADPARRRGGAPRRRARRALAPEPSRRVTSPWATTTRRPDRTTRGPARSTSAGLAGSRPTNADLLGAAALTEQSLGRWEAALGHLARALALDPRSAHRRAAPRRQLLPAALCRRRARPPTAPSRSRRPTVMVLDERAMVALAQGDLDTARAVIRGGARRGSTPRRSWHYVATY